MENNFNKPGKPAARTLDTSQLPDNQAWIKKVMENSRQPLLDNTGLAEKYAKKYPASYAKKLSLSGPKRNYMELEEMEERYTDVMDRLERLTNEDDMMATSSEAVEMMDESMSETKRSDYAKKKIEVLNSAVQDRKSDKISDEEFDDIVGDILSDTGHLDDLFRK